MTIRTALRRLGCGAVLIAGVLGWSLPAQAWGREAHRLIAELAERDLQPATRLAVDDLLVDESEPTLAGISYWADDIRPVHPESGPLHYVNIGSADCRYTAARDCPAGRCVVAAIGDARTKLARMSAPAEHRRDALKALVHFIADVHQPLHAAPGDSRGGNRIQIRWQGRGSNLHRLWDTQLLRALELPRSAHLRRLASLAGRVDDSAADPAGWAAESCRMVLSPGFIPASARLDEAAYLGRWQGSLDIRLVQAARRLAATLNADLGR